MLKSKILLRRHASYLKWSYASARRFSQTAEESEEIIINPDVRLAPLPTKKPQREPFVKNLFIGKFDNQVIAYPEVQTNERQNQFNEWLAPIEDCVNRNFNSKETDENILPFQAVEQLRELGVFRASLSEEHKGVGLTTTEYARLVEILGKNPSLAAYVASRTDPIELLVKFGSEEQKKRYLPRFTSGELIPALAISEDNTGVSTTPLAATAVATECGKYWKLNAEKIFVSNGNQANCFVVLANCTETDDPLHKPEAPTIFITEREHGGITSSTIAKKFGHRAVETCSVNFKDTLVPKENVIDKVGSGPLIMINLLTLGKYNVGSQAASILRRLIGEVTKYSMEQRYFDKQLMTTDYAQEVIAKMTTTLFAIESMIYLTTGLEDQFQDQDISVESAIVEAYSARECVAQVYQGLQLVGRQSYLEGGPFERIYRDALALTLFNGSNVDLYTFIAIMGLHRAGYNNAEMVQKYRNPFMNPKYILKEVFASREGPDLAIEEHLHPSLIVSARLLQKSIHMLAESTETLLINHGKKVVEVHMDLRRLSDMAMDIYAMTAALARSSRSYCIGLRHCTDDIYLAHVICFNGHNRVKINHDEIDSGDTNNCDDVYRKISRRVLQQKGYFSEHPLKKNF